MTQRNMSLCKQIVGVTFSLFIGGIAGALFVWYPDFNIHLSSPELMFLSLATAVTIPSAIVFGLPVFFILRRFRALNIFSVSLIGVGSGLLATVLLAARGVIDFQKRIAQIETKEG